MPAPSIDTLTTRFSSGSWRGHGPTSDTITAVDMARDPWFAAGYGDGGLQLDQLACGCSVQGRRPTDQGSTPVQAAALPWSCST